MACPRGSLARAGHGMTNDEDVSDWPKGLFVDARPGPDSTLWARSLPCMQLLALRCLQSAQCLLQGRACRRRRPLLGHRIVAFRRSSKSTT